MVNPCRISRRDFLGNTTLLGGGLALAGYPGEVRRTAAAEPNPSPTATPAAAAPARSGNGLSPQTIAVIGEVAKRNWAPNWTGFNIASTAEEHIANHHRDLDALLHAFRQEKLSRLEFRGNLVFAHEAFLKWLFPTTAETMIRCVDGLREAGCTGIDINAGLYPWLNGDRENMQKLEKVIAHIRKQGLHLALNPELQPLAGVRLADWPAYTDASVKIWSMLAQRFQPEVLMVTHEPSVMNKRIGFRPDDEQWLDYVRRTAAAVKRTSPRTKVGVGFIPWLPPDLSYAEKWVHLDELELFSVDIYFLQGLGRTHRVLELAKAAGKGIFIEETWRPAFLPPEQRKNVVDPAAHGIGNEMFQALDEKWLETVYTYGAAMGMQAVVPFWTHTFFKYLPGDGYAYDPAYNRAVVDALAKGERTKTHAFNKKMSQEFGRSRPAA